MARPPDEYQGHFGLQDREKLRKKTARELVYALANRHGELRHARFKKDASTKTLHVTLWWNVADADRIEAAADRLVSALKVWVWDTWSVRLQSAETPAPDVVWDPYDEKFVPRKAYRPLGTPGKVRRAG